jgi:ATP-dependent DNA ligase
MRSDRCRIGAGLGEASPGITAPVKTGLPVRPPFAPMLARLTRELPEDGYLYEPKWDGFRCLAFRERGDVDLRSRNHRPLARYFPELVAALLQLPGDCFVLDGEIVVATSQGLDFDALLRRLHPAASRIERLRVETPAALIAFDLVAVGSLELCTRPFRERRQLLAELFAGAEAPLYLTPLTENVREAEEWLSRYQGRGIDGVVAKHAELNYESGVRSMLKVKRERTADCVVAGFRWFADRPLPSSVLLGLYDDSGSLRHIGIASSFAEARRRELLEELRPHVTELSGHPWERGFLLGGGATGKLRGAAGRWSPEEMEQDWTPLVPNLVCEVAFDQVDDYRLRHPARFKRWRPDLEPRDCTLHQLDAPRATLAELLPET